MSRIYGGNLCPQAVRLRIIRAFLSEECRIVSHYRKMKKAKILNHRKKQASIQEKAMRKARARKGRMAGGLSSKKKTGKKGKKGKK